MTQPKNIYDEEELKHKIDESLDEALDETFPASDPIAPGNPPLDEKPMRKQ